MFLKIILPRQTSICHYRLKWSLLQEGFMLSQASNSLHTIPEEIPSSFALCNPPRSNWRKTVNYLLSVKVKLFLLVASHNRERKESIICQPLPFLCSSSFYFSFFPLSGPYWSCVLLEGFAYRYSLSLTSMPLYHTSAHTSTPNPSLVQPGDVFFPI